MKVSVLFKLYGLIFIILVSTGICDHLNEKKNLFGHGIHNVNCTYSVAW